MNAPETKVPLPSRLHSAFALVGWLALCFGVASLGAIFMPGEWYAYFEEAVVESARVDFRSGLDGALHDDGGGRMAGVAAGWLGQTAQAASSCFLVQLAFNALWTPLFFGLHWPGVAFAEIVLLWLAIAATLDSLSSRESRCCLAACALPGVGEFRGAVEFHFVATEPLNL